MHYIYTDYLGSLKCVTDASGNVEQRLNYDVWGKRLNALTGAPFIFPTDGVDSANFLFARGYTGHSLSDHWRKHLDEFGLINMNGRIYDPVLGIFLSPDIAVQSPENSQSYNRYSYCMNNPLMFTDPSGYKWKWSYLIPGFGAVQAASDAVKDNPRQASDLGAFVLNPFRGISTIASGIEAINNGFDITKMDPTKPGTKTNNSACLYKGLFEWDPERGGDNRFWGNFWEVAARFTPWQAKSTIEGLLYTNTVNYFCEVDKVETYHGATVMFMDHGHYEGSSIFRSGGITLGNYITINSGIPSSNITDNNNLLLRHEYGHYRQARDYGPLAVYMGPNSLLANLGLSSVNADDTWWETDANARSYQYLSGYATNTENQAFVNDYKMVWGGGKWWRYLPFLSIYTTTLYNIHNSGN